MAFPKVLSCYEDTISSIEFNDPSLTQQQFADEVNIHTIIEKSKVRGLPQGDRKPLIGDFSNLADFREAQEMIVNAQQSFAQLPAKVRDMFQNQPERLFEFLANEENRPMAEQLGLVEPKKAVPIPTLDVMGTTDPNSSQDGVKN